MTVYSNIHTTVGRLIYFVLFPLFIIHHSTRTRALIFDETGRILLVKNWVSNDTWDMPGGGLHRGESPSVGVSREVCEETEIKIDKNDWRLLTRQKQYATTFIYFTATIQSKKIKHQKLEITEAGWFEVDALPARHHTFIDELLSTLSS